MKKLLVLAVLATVFVGSTQLSAQHPRAAVRGGGTGSSWGWVAPTIGTIAVVAAGVVAGTQNSTDNVHSH